MQGSLDKRMQDRFDAVWQQIQKNNAMTFLRHAVRLEMTLEQLSAALEYRQLHESVAALPFRELLTVALNNQRSQQRAAAPSGVVSKKNRRKRRGQQELGRLRDVVLERLRGALSSQTTSHLCEVVNNGGFDVDLLQMNRLLNALESQGYVICLGGKPKAWRLKPQGRTAPEPMVVVRKAAGADKTTAAG